MVNGLSRDLVVDNTTGLVTVDSELVRGNWVQILYKTLKRAGPAWPGGMEYDPADFDGFMFA